MLLSGDINKGEYISSDNVAKDEREELINDR